MNWIRLRLWFANIIGFFASYPIFAYGVTVLILLLLIAGSIRSCAKRGPSTDRIEKQNRENERRRKEELENKLSDVKNKIAAADEEVNRARNQNLSNQDGEQLRLEIERKARDF